VRVAPAKVPTEDQRLQAELIRAIDDYLAQHNKQPKPFIWTAKAADILENLKRARAALPSLDKAASA